MRRLTKLAGNGVVAKELLPLPVPEVTEEERDWMSRQSDAHHKSGVSDQALNLAAGSRAWLWLLVVCLNFLYSSRGKMKSRATVCGPPSLAQVASLDGLEALVFDFVCQEGTIPSQDWREFLAMRNTNFNGGEVTVARKLEWRLLEPTLPPRDSIGVVAAADLAEGGVAEYLNNPDWLLKPRSEWPVRPGQARVQVVQDGWEEVAAGLVESKNDFLDNTLHEAWIPYLAFGRPVDGSVIGLQAELRKDAVLPGADKAYWQAYLDNYDGVQTVKQDQLGELEGSLSEWQKAVREAYQIWGLPRKEKKTVVRSLTADTLGGGQVDGVAGLIRPRLAKVLQYLGYVLHMLNEGMVSKNGLQIGLGGLVYFAQFRRPVMSSFRFVWKHLRHISSGPKAKLPVAVQDELLLSICLLPLCCIDIRAPVSLLVTISDASESGGAVCGSTRLSEMGIKAARAPPETQRGEDEKTVASNRDSLLVVGLFDGICGLGRALEVLRVPLCAYISCEIDAKAVRVVKSRFPQVRELGDIGKVTRTKIQDFAVEFPRVSLVLIAGVAPCQGVSGLNASGLGLDDPRSALHGHIGKIKKTWAVVRLLDENVASRSNEDLGTYSEDAGFVPLIICAGGISRCRRPRFYWVDWSIQSGPGVRIPEGEMYHKVFLEAQLAPVNRWAASGWFPAGGESHRFHTFSRAIPQDKPTFKPAGISKCSAKDV
ncbi:unnamed protein product [Polarella glacialis]|uniref:DNA (cytosine-5-)-methyltransferase n=1 Tax=Polarella glacialis TaxID=89957 RepID=A0A813DG44_POLGL|nr:unnamed protein product [Polarella glacialis]